MLLKQISSCEKATEVIHRRAVIFDIILSAGRHHHTRLASCIMQAAPSIQAQLLHVDLSQFSRNRMYTETQPSMRHLLFQIQIRQTDTS